MSQAWEAPRPFPRPLVRSELSDAVRIERHVNRIVQHEPALVDVAAVLQLAARSDDPAIATVERLQALCELAARSLGKYDADSRMAPASALAELVRVARVDCANERNGCAEQVVPWSYNGRHCSPSCERQDGRLRLHSPVQP